MKTEVLKTYQDFKEFHSKVKKKKSQTVNCSLNYLLPSIESSQEIVVNLHCYVPLLINETVVLIRVFTLFYQFMTLVKFLWLRLKDIVVLTPNNRHFV